RPAVVGDEQLEPALDRVPEGDAVLVVPERDGVEEAVGLSILELEDPRLPTVRRLIDPGLLAGAGAQQVGGGLPERLDVAEVEFLRTGDRPDRPSPTAVGSPPIRPSRAADPRDGRADGAQAAEVRGGAGG